MTQFRDVSDLLDLPRVNGLVLSPDGSRLVAPVARLDEAGTKYVTALWEIDPEGKREATRLTRSSAGESAPAFLPDGSLLFTSKRPDPDRKGGGEERTRLWRLPVNGEAYPLADSPGGLSGPVAARDEPVFVATTDRLPGASAEEDRTWRGSRSDRSVTAVVHDGFPIRHWDHELGPGRPRLLAGTLDPGGELRELASDSGRELDYAGYDITPDGSTVVTGWSVPQPRGILHATLVAVDVATGQRRTLADEPGADHDGPVISPDGALVAGVRETDADFDTAPQVDVCVHTLDGSAPARRLHVGDDVSPGALAWSPDSATLYVCGARNGRGTVLAVDVRSGSRRHLATDAVYTNPCPSPDGRHVYALRTAPDCPPTPVRLDAGATEQEPVYLLSPAPRPELPGTVTDVTAVAADGATVRGWLVMPAEHDGPVPLQVWVHGGPFSSWNTWSWRWNPWVAVARGWAVLMPDPALSVGYGQAWRQRAWPHHAAEVWADVETLLDTVVARDDVDADRTACLGASFGGFMTNWIAGHTDRFRAIVTHAGLWAFDQQFTTTDYAWWKCRVWGRPQDRPEFFAANSPHHFADRIRTPMLVSHGNRDYRVPYSEALRLWWDLVSRFDGDPADLPHRFLQFPDEGHWILSPVHARVFYETVLAFLEWHVLGGRWTPPTLS